MPQSPWSKLDRLSQRMLSDLVWQIDRMPQEQRMDAIIALHTEVFPYALWYAKTMMLPENETRKLFVERAEWLVVNTLPAD